MTSHGHRKRTIIVLGVVTIAALVVLATFSQISNSSIPSIDKYVIFTVRPDTSTVATLNVTGALTNLNCTGENGITIHVLSALPTTTPLILLEIVTQPNVKPAQYVFFCTASFGKSSVNFAITVNVVNTNFWAFVDNYLDAIIVIVVLAVVLGAFFFTKRHYK